jgi:hypothetical protein
VLFRARVLAFGIFKLKIWLQAFEIRALIICLKFYYTNVQGKILALLNFSARLALPNFLACQAQDLGLIKYKVQARPTSIMFSMF